MSTETVIREFIMKNLAVFDDDVHFDDDDNIFQKGFVNSLFAMRLLNFVESQFSFKLDPADLNIENFSSVTRITALIEKYSHV